MPGGRPKKPIDLDMVQKLAHIQCTQAEIATFLDISLDTLKRSREFRTIYKKAMEEGRSSLRRLQWKAASDGNVTMQIWLGKQYLQQREQPAQDDADEKLANLVKAIEKNVKTDV